MSVVGNRAYVSSGTTGVLVVDLFDATRPRIVGVIDTPGASLGVYVDDGYLFIADGSLGLGVIELIEQPYDMRVSSETSVHATFPAGLNSGLYHVIVRNPDGGAGILHNGLIVD